MSIPNYEDNSQTIAVLEGVVGLILEASGTIESVLGKPLDFNADAWYDPEEVIGVYVMSSADKPGSALTVSVYIADPNIGPGLTQYAIQIRARSETKDYRPAMFMLDAIRDHSNGPRLNGRTHADLSGYNATIIYSQNIGDMGLDSADRYELTENYYLIVNDEPGKVLPFPRTE